MDLPGLIGLPDRADLRDRYRQFLTSAGYVSLLALGLLVGHVPGQMASLGLMAALGFLAWASTYKRARAISDIATSRIGAAAQGYVELVGRASGAPSEMIVTPFSGLPCIWYRYRIYSKSEGRGDWHEVDRGSSHFTFEISDGSGVCRIDPDHAEVIAPSRRTTRQGDDKQVEEFLLRGSVIYVLGELRTLGGAQAALNLSADVSALLGSWKQDPVELKRRFDLDGNGEIDLQEWALARRLATRTVEKEHREIRSIGDAHIVQAPADGRMFLISTLSPQKLRQRFLAWSLFHLAVALLALGGIVWLQR
jgi:hypothetical protein